MNESDKKRVVVIDDEPPLLRIVDMKLSGVGYEVITAEDGHEGWQAVLTQQPDLVIADYAMPYLDGLQLCQRMAQHPETANIPLLMFTAHWRKIAPECMGYSNVAGAVEKPFSPRELVQIVERVIAESQQRKSA